MFTKSDIFYTITSLAIFVVISSLLFGYLGSYGNSNKFKMPVIEGFQANDDNIEGINEKVSDGVVEVEDKLRVDKYKDEYKKLVSVTRDLMENLKLSALMDLNDITKHDLNDEARLFNKTRAIGSKLSMLHKAIIVLDKFNFADNGGSSKSDSSDGGGKGGGSGWW